ncbi:ester cyclase [Tenacibaculum sp. 47A_GOM-205m]|uniref:ester cyclase n=1 Tax=Tenacibaculum sp. 47A_GOM-205m TaxID=1380384 RepID=UPI00048F1427|nr:ester cyclase [Tenacibaculum sp. 47A_GOM-205m]
MENNLEYNKQLVRDFYTAVDREDYDAASAFLHEDFTFYVQVDNPIPGADGFVASEKKNFDAFGDFSFQIIDLIAEGNKVAVYMIHEGTHNKNPLMGLEPKGNIIRFSLMMWLTIEDGKIIEKRAHFDRTDIKEQAVR